MRKLPLAVYTTVVPKQAALLLSIKTDKKTKMINWIGDAAIPAQCYAGQEPGIFHTLIRLGIIYSLTMDVSEYGEDGYYYEYYLTIYGKALIRIIKQTYTKEEMGV